APAFLRVSAHADQPLDLTHHIKRAINHLQLDALIVIGSNTSLKFGARLSREGVPVIGIPKSVHNDIAGTTYTLGTSTAVRRGVGFVREVREIAASREEIAVISVLGHESGLTTMFVSMFANADRTLIPEVPFDPVRLGELLLDDQRRNPSNYAILVMSDTARIDPSRAPEKVAELSADVVVAGERGSGPMVVRVLEEVSGQRFLHQPLSYLTRTGDADGWDLLAATNFGIIAVDLIAQGTAGRLVAFRLEDGYIDIPLEEVTRPYEIDVTDFYDTQTYTVKHNIFTVGAMRKLGL
ncbi:MAG: 6-phosphofructokinase, partial [Chloroflexota bacterium]